MGFSQMNNVIVCVKCGKKRPEQAMLKWLVKRGLTKTELCRACYLEEKRKRSLDDRREWLRSDGYYEICVPRSHRFYSMASKTRHTILVHRLIMAEYLGRALSSKEIVHHINGIKTDNRIENLELKTPKNHPLSYQDGYANGLREGIAIRDRQLEKQIKLLQWQIKELSQQLQVKLALFGV